MAINVTKEEIMVAIEQAGILIKHVGVVGEGEYGEDVDGYNVFIIKQLQDGEGFRYVTKQVIMDGEHVFEYDGGGYSKTQDLAETVVREAGGNELAREVSGRSHYFNAI